MRALTDRRAIGGGFPFPGVVGRVVTPLALDWQIAVSFDRLFVQIWPALVGIGFQLSRDDRPVPEPEAQIVSPKP